VAETFRWTKIDPFRHTKANKGEWTEEEKLRFELALQDPACYSKVNKASTPWESKVCLGSPSKTRYVPWYETFSFSSQILFHPMPAACYDQEVRE
jgi:hypothetical protein